MDVSTRKCEIHFINKQTSKINTYGRNESIASHGLKAHNNNGNMYNSLSGITPCRKGDFYHFIVMINFMKIFRILLLT